ncbi:hypothetical protein Golomagni_05849 [Golovinomyces magnicellulatus]|nr:hypothetical protein Golomagni_05849 [Golovinomyces magnicellulatus]
MATITILYPSGPSFDLKYYLDTHMPLVAKNWTSEGLQSWEITQFAPGAPYQIQATLKFSSVSAWQAASSGESSKPVFGDIPNFTEAQPVVLTGTHQASSQ